MFCHTGGLLLAFDLITSFSRKPFDCFRQLFLFRDDRMERHPDHQVVQVIAQGACVGLQADAGLAGAVKIAEGDTGALIGDAPVRQEKERIAGKRNFTVLLPAM